MSDDRLGQTAIVLASLSIVAAIVVIVSAIAEGGWNLIWVPIAVAFIAWNAWTINDIRGKRRRNRQAER